MGEKIRGMLPIYDEMNEGASPLVSSVNYAKTLEDLVEVMRTRTNRIELWAADHKAEPWPQPLFLDFPLDLPEDFRG